MIIVITAYAIISKTSNLFNSFKDSWAVVAYLVSLTLISYLRSKHLIPFPEDNILVVVVALIFCKILVNAKLEKSQIANNLERLNVEVLASAKE